MEKNLTPAKKVITAAGGSIRLAKLLGIDKSWVGRWLKPKSKLGTGGKIPSPHFKRILELSEQNNWNITANDLII